MRAGNLPSIPATRCASKNDRSPLCASRMQDTSQAEFHLATRTQSGWAGVSKGTGCLSFLDAPCINRSNEVSWQCFWDRSRSRNTSTNDSLTLPGLPKGCCSSASTPKISLCLKAHLKATQSSCSMRFWLWQDLPPMLATAIKLLVLVSSKWQSISRIFVRRCLCTFTFFFSYLTIKINFCEPQWVL